MKTYNATNMVSSKLKKVINNCLNHHERYSNCYFWKNTGSAASRRSQEKQFAENNPFLT